MTTTRSWTQWAFGLLALCLAAAANAQMFPIEGEDDEPIPEPDVILQRMREAFPDVPVLIEGRLVRRASRNENEQEWLAKILLDWNAAPPRASLHMADAFGRPVGMVRIRYAEGGARFSFHLEPDGAAEAPPRADDPLLGTDFTWADLALSFLWWTGGEWRGFESRRGRRCYVLDIASPEPTDHAASVRLWIDAHAYALLQAEVRNRDGVAMRRLSVRSLRRVGLRWTLEDLEMRTLAANTRTLLHVVRMDVLDDDPTEDVP